LDRPAALLPGASRLASLAALVAGGRTGGGLFLRRAVRRNPACTAGFSGPSPELFRATPAGRDQCLGHMPAMPASRRSACETSPRPPCRCGFVCWWDGSASRPF